MECENNMTIIQLNLDDVENDIVNIFKAKNRLKTKSLSVKKIIRDHK